MYSVLDQEIKFLRGVGPRRAQLLADELDIRTLRDLIYFFPFRYIDRSQVYTVSQLTPDMQFVQLMGEITDFYTLGTGSSRRIEATFRDRTGSIRLVWFRGLKYVEKGLRKHTPYILLGKPAVFNGVVNIAHPDLDVLDDAAKLQAVTGLRPVYRSTDKLKRSGITPNLMESFVDAAFAQLRGVPLSETLPDYLLHKHNLMPLNEALRQIHHPESLDVIPHVERRLKFEELFYVQLDVLSYAHTLSKKYRGYVFNRIGWRFHKFYSEHLPFQLTDAQKRVMHEIRRDLATGRQMNRLLQGDVGSGKTIVSVMSMLIALDNGYQACIMAPTEILAEQHYDTVRSMLEPIGIQVELLTGIVKGKRRAKVFDDLRTGHVDIVVGTHALLGDDVVFSNLGLAVIDEQHRFGVEQRAKLWRKNTNPPHILIMTATPIPRTLAMTVYGDLDVSVIDQLPPGRKPIKTLHVYDKNVDDRVELVRREVALGHQAYFVYPLIKESEKMDLKDLERGYQQICREFPDMTAAMLHGQMKPVEKNEVMTRFLSGEVQLLVSTTVIEVGVNVPNASVMIIQNAERFGLAQLHQLRGRVGRGAEQSYCVLVTGYKLSETTRCRMEIMCQTTDGFRIAEEDLKLRGPGDLDGTVQSGVLFNFKIASMARDGVLMQLARDEAQRLLSQDPDFLQPQNHVIAQQLRLYRQSNVNWSAIS